MTPATSAITEALPPAQQGVGSALNDLSREVGGATGIAVIGSILTSTYASHVNLAGLPGQIASEVKASYAIASHLGAQAADRAHAAFVSAMQLAMLTAAGAVLIARRRDGCPAGSSTADGTNPRARAPVHRRRGVVLSGHPLAGMLIRLDPLSPARISVGQRIPLKLVTREHLHTRSLSAGVRGCSVHCETRCGSRTFA